MAINKIKVSELPVATDPTRFDIFGQDKVTGDSAKASMSELVGPTGPAPDMTIVVNAIPHGQNPTVDKTGTDTAPTFTIGFPLAKDGEKPILRKTDTSIEYRYNETEQWQTLVLFDDLRLKYSDLTPEQIAELQAPALEAAETANEAADNANTKANAAQDAADNADTKASLAAEKAAIAEEKAGAAQDAADNADEKAALANDKAALAATATSNANTATENANQAAGTATAAAELAQTAAGKSEELNANPPKIINATWWVYNLATKTYVDTGTTSQGKGPIVLPNGNYGNWDEALGQYVDSNVPASTTVDLQNVPVYFNEAEERELIASGETVPDAFSKLLKMQSDMGGLAFRDSVDYETEVANKPNLSNVAISGNYNDLNNKPAFRTVLTDAQYSANGTTITATFAQYNAATGEISSVTRLFPVVSETAAGSMTAEAYGVLLQLNNDVAALKNQGGRYIGVSFATKSDLDSYVIPAGVNAGDYTFVLDDESHEDATTRYVATDFDGTIGFEFAFVVNHDPVGIANLEQAGIVKSSEADGKAFVEADGTMSVIGWDALKLRVSNIEEPNGEDTLFVENGGGIKVNPLYLSGSGALPIGAQMYMPWTDDVVNYNGETWLKMNGQIFYEDDYPELASLPGMMRAYPIKMITNSAPAPYLAKASSNFSASHSAFHAFDGDVSTQWMSTEESAWLRIFVGNLGLRADRYSLNFSQHPLDWTFEGSNDGDTWDILDQVVENSTTEGVFPILVPEYYSYYRLNVTRHYGTAGVFELGLVMGFTPSMDTSSAGHWMYVKAK